MIKLQTIKKGKYNYINYLISLVNQLVGIILIFGGRH